MPCRRTTARRRGLRTDYIALATDYDGTSANDGRVDVATLASLRRWRDSGRHLIFVIGCALDDLLGVLPPLDLFEGIIAENGALLYAPAKRESRVLAPRPPLAFIGRYGKRTCYYFPSVP